MRDNDPSLHRLARIEHDFIAALGALNFGDQARQLRQAFKDIQSFHFAHRSGSYVFAPGIDGHASAGDVDEGSWSTHSRVVGVEAAVFAVEAPR